MNIPKLNKSTRNREFNIYNKYQHSNVLKAYLIDGKSNRDIDIKILKAPKKSNGFHSFGILHYLGVTYDFKGLFANHSLQEVINEFKKNNHNNTYSDIINLLELENSLNTNTPDNETILSQNTFFPESDIPSNSYEGAIKTILVNKYERSASARKNCIKFHGTNCSICGFNFSKIYGNLGKDFIHIHHIVPLNLIGKEYIVDYKKDLIPVCPNCHAMLHRKINGKNITVDELKNILNQNK